MYSILVLFILLNFNHQSYAGNGLMEIPRALQDLHDYWIKVHWPIIGDQRNQETIYNLMFHESTVLLLVGMRTAT